MAALANFALGRSSAACKARYSTVKVKESHQLSLPMIHLDPRHKLTLEYLALHAALERPNAKLAKAAKAKKRA